MDTRRIAPRILVCIVALLVVGLWQIPESVQGQGTTILRPTSYTAAGANSLGSPGSAVDTNTASAANSSDWVACNTVCMTPKIRETQWWSFPAPSADYVPVTLTVVWSLNASVDVWPGNFALVTATIQYSTNNGSSWSLLPNGTSTLSTSSTFFSSIYTATANLPGGLNLANLKIKATLDTRMSTCTNCGNNSSANGQIYVYDINVSVQRPTLTLYLDANNDFSVSSPQSDAGTFVPGSNFSTGASLPLPSGTTLIDTVEVIAAYTVSTGVIVPPPSGVTFAAMSLTQDSGYSGIAMNYNPASSNDLLLSASTATFGSDNTARMNLEIRDYAARGTVTASAGSTPDTATMQVPKDISPANGIPDVGWRDKNGNLIADTFTSPQADADSTPTGDGTDGDGLGAIEEYRGFAVAGVHVRTNPSRKDLFVRSELSAGVGAAVNLGVDLHALASGDMDTSNRRINPWYGNAGYGGALHSGTFQHGVHVVNGGYKLSTFGEVTVVGTPNVQTGPVNIYVETIQYCSPTVHSKTTSETVDSAAIVGIIGHEIGHDVRISHYPYNPNAVPARLTVMANEYYPCPPPDGLWTPGDPIFSEWSTIFLTYDATDLGMLRIK